MIWKSKIKGDDKIIAYHNGIIYKGNPKDDQVEHVAQQLKSQEVPPISLFGIPQSLLKEINFEEGKNHIEITFGAASSEVLNINDDSKRLEVFDYFKNNIPNSEYSTENYSKVKAGKKQLIAMSLIICLFLWTYSIAIGIEDGNQYEAGGSIAGIVLAIASLGVLKVILIYGALFIIPVIGFVLKTKNPKVVHTVKIIR